MVSIKTGWWFLIGQPVFLVCDTVFDTSPEPDHTHHIEPDVTQTDAKWLGDAT